MAVLAQQQQPSAVAEERRRFQRVKVHLLGRYMLPDQREFPCKVLDMSPGGLALQGQGIGRVGDRVIAYLDHVGRVEGKIARIMDNGFAMTVSATPRKREKLAAQLTWLANRDILNLPEDRRHERVAVRAPLVRIIFDDGLELSGMIEDLSLSGAAITADYRPAIGTNVTLGEVPARVVRHLEDGFALEFLHEQNPETLLDSVTAK
jgi:hypothetical protein